MALVSETEPRVRIEVQAAVYLTGQIPGEKYAVVATLQPDSRHSEMLVGPRLRKVQVFPSSQATVAL